MKAVMIRDLKEEELEALKQGLRSPDAFTLRRCQILLASNQKKTPQQIATELHCSDQCVREAIHAFHAQGLACLMAQSHATHTPRWALDGAGRERLRELLHQSPRQFGRDSSVWTLDLVAEVSFAQGITAQRVNRETIRRALERLGENWKRAKQWISSPDPKYQQKSGAGTGWCSSGKPTRTGCWSGKMSAGSVALPNPR